MSSIDVGIKQKLCLKIFIPVFGHSYKSALLSCIKCIIFNLPDFIAFLNKTEIPNTNCNKLERFSNKSCQVYQMYRGLLSLLPNKAVSAQNKSKIGREYFKLYMVKNYGWNAASLTFLPWFVKQCFFAIHFLLEIQKALAGIVPSLQEKELQIRLFCQWVQIDWLELQLYLPKWHVVPPLELERHLLTPMKYRFSFNVAKNLGSVI